MSEALQQEIRHLRTLEGSARDPRDRIFLPLADVHLRLGDTDRARELLEDGLTRHPDFVCGHILMARLLEEEGDASEAEERWATARRLDPENPDVLLALGRLLLGRGESLGGQLVLKARAMDPTAGGQEPDADLVMISDLAPGLPDEIPVVSIADLAPDPEAGVVPIADLAPSADAAPSSVVEQEAVEVEPARQETAEPFTMDVEADAVVEDVDVEGADMVADAGRDGRVVTRTLAELFAAQGQRERAVEMYEELVSRRPDDEALRTRLEELRSDDWEAGSAQEGAPDAPETADEIATTDATPEIREVPAEADAADEEEFDPRLSPAAPEPEVSTPFAWTASGEAEDVAPDEAASADESPDDELISDYLGGLLGYVSERASDDPSGS